MKIGTEITRLDIRVRDYQYKGTNWLLAYAPECEQFVAINHKYIKRDGMAWQLTKPLNGLEMHLSPDMHSTIESLTRAVDLDEFLASGLTKAQAICAVMGLEYKPELEVLLS